MNYDDLVELSLEAGHRLLENGAETYRVEESVSRILHAYGVESAEVFAIPSCVIVTIRAKGSGLPNGEAEPAPDSFTRMRRILDRGTNLERVSRLNGICRRICRERPDCISARKEILEIAESKAYPFPVQVAAYALISFAFTLFFGGGMTDALYAILCGAALKLASAGMARLQTNWFFANIMGSAIVTAMAFAAVQLGLCPHMDKIIIGTLMNLVPGVALTNSIRDIIGGDLLAGLTRLTEALMIAAAIALGTGLALSGLRLLLPLA